MANPIRAWISRMRTRRLPKKVTVVGKNAIEACDLVAIPLVVQAFAEETRQGRQVPWLIQLLVDGYNEDPRALPEIPEVVKWFGALRRTHPYLPYLMDHDSILVYFQTAKLSLPIDVTAGLLPGGREAVLLAEIYAAGNNFCQTQFPEDAWLGARLATEATGRIRRALNLDR